jgi:hypothetical protein
MTTRRAAGGGTDGTYDSIIDGVGFIEPSIVDVVKRDRATCDP